MNAGERQAASMTPFLRGSFRTFPLDEILGVLALGRQTLGMRFLDGDRELGAIAVKAGRVIGAQDYRSRTEGADALQALAGDPGTAFALIVLPRNGPEVPEDAAIGRLGELIPGTDEGQPDAATGAEPVFDSVEPEPPISAVPDGKTGDAQPGPAPPGEASAGANEVILHGNVSDSGLAEMLEVLQFNEQPLAVSFMREGAGIGTLTVKSGQVLAATAGDAQGIEAFRRLYPARGDTFEVRRATGGSSSEALGSVTELLDRGERRLPPVAPSAAPDSEDDSPAVRERPCRDGAPAQTAAAHELLSQTATAVARLLAELEAAQKGAILEIRNTLAGREPRREDRLLLRAVLAVQGVSLTLTLGLLAIAIL